jgi:hypothetical protein
VPVGIPELMYFGYLHDCRDGSSLAREQPAKRKRFIDKPKRIPIMTHCWPITDTLTDDLDHHMTDPSILGI